MPRTTAAARSCFPKLPRRGGEHQERGQGGHADQQPLALLRANPRNEDDAEADAAQNSADRVRRVDSADEPRRVLPARRRRQRERKTRAPQKRRREQRPQAARHVQLKVQPRICGQRRVNRPIRQGFGQHVSRPEDRRRQKKLAPAEQNSGPRTAAGQRRANAAADAQSEKKHGQNDGKGINRSAERQRQQPRPDHFRAHRRHPRKRNGDIHRPWRFSGAPVCQNGLCPCSRRAGDLRSDLLFKPRRNGQGNRRQRNRSVDGRRDKRGEN